jgi:hypothetical protein
LGGVCPAGLQQEDVHTVGKCLGKGIHNKRKALGMQLRSCKKAALTRGRGHRPIDGEPFEDVLDRPQGLAPARREAAAAHGQQAKTTFVLAEHAHWAGLLRRDDALERLRTGRLKIPHGGRMFWCDWAAAP